MAVETIPLREIEEHTKDMYEATLVVAKRARQIISERIAEKEIQEEEMEPGLLEEEPEVIEDYEECEKATSMALKEFLKGELEWGYSSEEDLDTEEDSTL